VHVKLFHRIVSYRIEKKHALCDITSYVVSLRGQNCLEAIDGDDCIETGLSSVRIKKFICRSTNDRTNKQK